MGKLQVNLTWRNIPATLESLGPGHRAFFIVSVKVHTIRIYISKRDRLLTWGDGDSNPRENIPGQRPPPGVSAPRQPDARQNWNENQKWTKISARFSGERFQKCSKIIYRNKIWFEIYFQNNGSWNNELTDRESR